MKKVGILGGTFNPPHNGHLSIAEALLEEFSLDEVVLLPAGQPPHKQNVTESVQRLEMLRLMARQNPRLRISEQELHRSGYTYTVDTLTELAQKTSDTVFYYIIGTDTLFSLTSWMRFREVFRLTQFLCVPRPGDDPEDIRQKISELAREYGAQIHLSIHKGPEISSTQVRSLAAAGESLRGLVPPDIEEYINKNGIFRP